MKSEPVYHASLTSVQVFLVCLIIGIIFVIIKKIFRKK